MNQPVHTLLITKIYKQAISRFALTDQRKLKKKIKDKLKTDHRKNKEIKGRQKTKQMQTKD